MRRRTRVLNLFFPVQISDMFICHARVSAGEQDLRLERGGVERGWNRRIFGEYGDALSSSLVANCAEPVLERMELWVHGTMRLCVYESREGDCNLIPLEGSAVWLAQAW